MSFEGYYQILCKNGHEHSADCYADVANAKCPFCKASAKWENLVDQTNGSYEGKKRIDGYVSLRVEKEVKTKLCKHCGTTKVLEQQTYRVPKNKGKLIK